jgi:predicted metal-dependent hydrolase
MAEDDASQPQYLAFFDEFNRQRFYEAHEVLESLWLPAREGADGAFYKGLIQVAGAFVHLQKDRFGPAIALLRLAGRNVSAYPEEYRQFDVQRLRELIQKWLGALEEARFNPLRFGPPPHLELISPAK